MNLGKDCQYFEVVDSTRQHDTGICVLGSNLSSVDGKPFKTCAEARVNIGKGNDCWTAKVAPPKG